MSSPGVPTFQHFHMFTSLEALQISSDKGFVEALLSRHDWLNYLSLVIHSTYGEVWRVMKIPTLYKCLVPLSTCPHLYAIQKPHATCHLISTGKGQRSQVLRAMCQEMWSGTKYRKLIQETKYIILIMPQGCFVPCDFDNVLSLFFFLYMFVYGI